MDSDYQNEHRETFIDEVGKKAQLTSKRESQISFEQSQRLNESGYNKVVRINVPK